MGPSAASAACKSGIWLVIESACRMSRLTAAGSAALLVATLATVGCGCRCRAWCAHDRRAPASSIAMTTTERVSHRHATSSCHIIMPHHHATSSSSSSCHIVMQPCTSILSTQHYAWVPTPSTAPCTSTAVSMRCCLSSALLLECRDRESALPTHNGSLIHRSMPSALSQLS